MVCLSTFSAMLYCFFSFSTLTTRSRHSYLPGIHSTTELYPDLDVLLTEASSLKKTIKVLLLLCFLCISSFPCPLQNSSPPQFNILAYHLYVFADVHCHMSHIPALFCDWFISMYRCPFGFLCATWTWTSPHEQMKHSAQDVVCRHRPHCFIRHPAHQQQRVDNIFLFPLENIKHALPIILCVL